MNPALAIGLLLAAPQQLPAPPIATFRSGIDVLRVEVSVLDAQGMAVTSLTPDAFLVKVDGHDRKVLFARFAGTPAAHAPVAHVRGARRPDPSRARRVGRWDGADDRVN